MSWHELHLLNAVCFFSKTTSRHGAMLPCSTTRCGGAGNIAGDGPEARRTLTANGAIRPLAAMVVAAQRGRSPTGHGGSLKAGQIAAWALSNIIKGAGREVSTLLGFLLA